jgi:DNA-binding LacI/PurR family transcriptional regulator
MTQKIGLIINNAVHIFQRDVIAGAETIAKANGYQVVVDTIAEDPQNPRPVSLPVDDMAGILVIANVLSDEDLQELYDTGKPITLVSHRV